MSLRGRITLIITTCFVALAAVLLVDGRSRELAAEQRLEETQLLMLRASWAGLLQAERQRLLGHLESFRRTPGAVASFSAGDRPGMDRATVAIRSDLRTTHVQALRLDGTAVYDSRGEDRSAPLLTPAQVTRVAERTEPVAGLIAAPDGTLSHALAAPILATSGVVGVAVLWGDAARVLAELSEAIGMQTMILAPDGSVRAEADAREPLPTARALAAPLAADRVALLRDGPRTLRVATVSQAGIFGAPAGRLVALEDVSAEMARRNQLWAISYTALASAMVLFFAFVNWSLRTAFRPLDAVIQSLDGLSAGRTDVQVTVPPRNDEIGRLAGTFESFRKGMEARSRLERLTRELDVAARIQAQCLPRAFPEEEGIAFAAAMRPMREVGGDFYDVFRLPDGRIGMVVADVSDKGMGAALFMAIARTAVRSTAMTTPDPGDCVRRVNAYLCEDNEEMLFVTLVYAILDPATGRIALCNAGHNPPAVIEPSGSVRLVQSTPQPALGVVEGATYGSSALQLAPDSRLVLYTDGVTEAMTADGAEFGEARLLETLAAAARDDAEPLVEHVFDTVEAFVDGAPRNDDITCMALVYRTG